MQWLSRLRGHSALQARDPACPTVRAVCARLRRQPAASSMQRLCVGLAGEVAIEQLREHGARRRHLREQGGRRTQLHVVRRTENVVRRHAALERQQRFGARRKPRPEHGVREIRGRLVATANRETPRRGAQTEARDLRKHVPHPVRLFLATLDLGERLRVVARLCLHEPLEIERIVHTGAAGHAASVLSAGRSVVLRT